MVIGAVGEGGVAQTVYSMTNPEYSKLNGIVDLALGDMLITPEGRTNSVRMLAVFPETGSRVRRTGGFVILGDFDSVLVSTGSSKSLTAYIPIETVPPQVAGSDLLAEGMAGFLAPHLPADASALEPVSWRAYRLAGKLEPLIVVYRGPQILVFLPATCYNISDIDVLKLPRTGSRLDPVNRHAVLVDLPAPTVESLPSIRQRPGVRRLLRSKR